MIVKLEFSLFIVLFISICPSAKDTLVAEDLPGKALYEQKCSQCHGLEGKGNGPAAGNVAPKPRDFTLGTYKIRTTPSGSLPTDEDLIGTISRGIPGTSMPDFEKALSKDEIKKLVAYLKTFYPGFNEAKPEPVKIGSPPRSSKSMIEKGKEHYKKFGCQQCHGLEGRAEGPSAPTLKDEKGDPILPADLTKPWRFRGGGEVKDIFTRLTTGLAGTPMASFTGLFPDEKEDVKARWELAYYILSLSEGHPNFKSVIAAENCAGEIPISFDDGAAGPWQEAEEVDFPLVGQVIVEPRLFVPSIDMVSASALYDDREVVLRVRWNDATHNAQPSRTKDSGPDFFSIQFPLEKASGSELPYFLAGDTAKPVQMLTWSSDNDKIVKQIFRGLGASENTDARFEAKAGYSQGRWTVYVRLPRASQDSKLNFEAGQFVPTAFQAGDGSNGEGGAKRSVSAWGYLLLKPRPARARFAWPLIAFAGTLCGEALFLKWIRKRSASNQDKGRTQ